MPDHVLSWKMSCAGWYRLHTSEPDWTNPVAYAWLARRPHRWVWRLADGIARGSEPPGPCRTLAEAKTKAREAFLAAETARIAGDTSVARAPDQKEMCRDADARIQAICGLFNDIQTGPNPLTQQEVDRLIAKRPAVYGVLAAWGTQSTEATR